MKLSIAVAKEAGEKAPIVLRGSYEKIVSQAAEIGYDAIELHIRDPKELDTEELKKLCLDKNICVSSIGTGSGYGIDKLSLSSKNELVRKKAIQRIKDHIKLAKQLNSLVIIGLIKGQIKESDTYEQYETNLISSLNECIEVAEKEDVILVLEAINRYESDTLCSIEECVEFIKKFNTDKLKIHIDTYHMNIEEENISENIIKAGDLIGHVHLADSNRLSPGKGHYNFKETINALKQIGYKGYLAMECLYYPEEYEAAKYAYDTMRHYLL